MTQGYKNALNYLVRSAYLHAHGRAASDLREAYLAEQEEARERWEESERENKQQVLEEEEE